MSAQLFQPTGVAVDATGNVYIADTNNLRARKVVNGLIMTIAGGMPLQGEAPGARLFGQITGVAVDGAGVVYITEWEGGRTLRLEDGVLRPIAANAPLVRSWSVAAGPSGKAYTTNSKMVDTVGVGPGWVTVLAPGESASP